MNNKIVSAYSNETNNLRNINNININDNNKIENNNSGNNVYENNNNEIITNTTNFRLIQVSIKFKCCTPYFIFGKTIFFYFPNSLKELDISDKYYTNTFDLSKMPDPPFSIGIQCKIISFYFFR